MRVLQLLAEHPIKRVQWAIERCERAEELCAERIIQHTHRLAEQEARSASTNETSISSDLADIDETFLTVQVPMRGRNPFDQFLS